MAIAVAVAFNVSLVDNKADKTSLLALANVEALADTENGGLNDFLTFWTQGLYKDEIENRETCSVVSVTTTTDPNIYAGVNVTVPVNGIPVGGQTTYDSGGSTHQVTVTYTGTRIWCEDGGSKNCSSKECNE